MGDSDFKLSKRIEESFFGAVGTSDCHKVGIMGGCGLECFVYQESRCHIPEEIKTYHVETDEDLEEHERLYCDLPKSPESSENT